MDYKTLSMIRKTDANQKDIMDKLRLIPHLSVFSTHIIGKGFPDIIIGYKGKNYMVEIKDGAKWKSQQKLTTDELLFHMKWKGQICTCNSFEQVWELLNQEY